MSSIGLGIAGAGVAYGVVNGIIQNNKANKIQQGLKDPTYHIPGEFYQNREIARQMAQQGLPQQQLNNAQNGINQNSAAGLATLSRSANPGAGVASVTRQADNATNTLAAEDAQARENNQRYFIGQNTALGGQELAKQQNDVFDKYTRDFNQMQAYRGAGQDSINNAISGAQNLGMTALNNANKTTPTATPAVPNIDPNVKTGQLGAGNASFNSYLGGQPAPQNTGLLSATNYDQSQAFAPMGMRPGTIMPNKPQYYDQGWGWPN